MDKSIEELTARISEALSREEAMEVMQLKLKLELSASSLFLALGWLLREGKITLERSEYGYRVRPAPLVNFS